VDGCASGDGEQYVSGSGGGVLIAEAEEPTERRLGDGERDNAEWDRDERDRRREG
jgi:hypothetical protein